MEYAAKEDFSDANACTSTEISGLKAGTYHIRIAETDTTLAGKATTVIVEDGPEVAAGTVKITGTPRYDQALTAKVTGSNLTKCKYQWKRNNKAIKGATKATYRLVKEDIGTVISCEVADAKGQIIKSITGKTTKIQKALGPAEPTGLKAVAPTKKGATDGQITGVNTTMEYATKDDFSDAKACTVTKISGLKAGTYYVRVKETDTTLAGKTAKLTVPEGKVVTPPPVPEKEDVTKVFKDVIAGQWYVNAIQYVYDRKIMNGTSKDTFEPNTVLTRAQFITVLHNMEGKPDAAYMNTITDVPPGKWYTTPIMWAYANDITSGIFLDEFGVNVKITREQLATLLYKYAVIKKYNTTFKDNVLDPYPDTDKISTWASESMKWAISNGVISGKPDNKGGKILDPKGEATRAECAQMIKNLFDNVINK